MTAPDDVALVRTLYRFFRLYERADDLAAAGRLDPAGADALYRFVRQLTFDFWRNFFGEDMDSPAHQRFVLSWCQKNLETLLRNGALPAQAHAAVAAQLARDMDEWKEDDPGYDFKKAGGTGAYRHTLRLLYLFQNLNVRLGQVADDGGIPQSVREQIRMDLLRRARTFFHGVLGDEPDDPVAEMAYARSTLDEYRRRGLLDVKEHRLLTTALGAPG